MKFRLALATTAGVTIAYLVFAGLLWSDADSNDPGWTHRLLIFSGIEAIAFAALGWLFGREINRHAVDQVDEAQEKAQQAAKESGEVAGRGQALADAVRAQAEAGAEEEARAIAGAEEGRERGPVGASRSVDNLRALADRLFPPT
jgi:hypothetical protein